MQDPADAEENSEEKKQREYMLSCIERARVVVNDINASAERKKKFKNIQETIIRQQKDIVNQSSILVDDSVGEDVLLNDDAIEQFNDEVIFNERAGRLGIDPSTFDVDHSPKGLTLKLKIDMTTRWNSIHRMLKRLANDVIRKSVQRFYKECNELINPFETETQWDELLQLSAILQPFHTVTSHMQNENHPVISDAWSSLHQLWRFVHGDCTNVRLFYFD